METSEKKVIEEGEGVEEKPTSKKGEEPSFKKQSQEKKRQKLKVRMGKVKHKIAVISGKGGVGKSTVAVNLAAAFAERGQPERVGVLDADLHGPSVPKIFGLSGERMKSGPPGVFPVSHPSGIKVVSIDFLLPDENAPVIWRGPLKMGAIQQFMSDIVWGNLDFLFIDLPPGTGDEPLSVAQLLPELDGVIIVTIPSEVSQVVVKKAVTFARKLDMPIIGIVENMSGFVCPECGTHTDIFQSGGGKRIADELDVPFLGSIPIDPKISEDSDKGLPFITEHPDSQSSQAFTEIVEEIKKFLKTKEDTKEEE
ncbi:MAG: Mrp/NBP35 family ATP-binding protein [Thermoproteota archaeon]